MTTTIHWFRRDLRVRDNTALFHAAQIADSLTGIFIIDPRWWLAKNGKLGAHQAAFWLASLEELRTALQGRNIPLVIRTNPDPVAELLKLARDLKADTLTYNKEYEPAQIEMDERLKRQAARIGLKIQPHKDAAFFEEQEILTGAGTIYSVFTPYKNTYLKKLADVVPSPLGLPRKMPATKRASTEKLPTPESLGFQNPTLDITPGEAAATKMLDIFCERPLATYADTRNFPALPQGTSRLSAHLNAGTLSIRQAIAAVISRKSRDTFLSQLIWRDFYRMILFNHPHTVSQPFQEKYRHLPWKNDPQHFAAWQNAATGYPIIDAAMMQLRLTGFMHNRLRMITAMFLTKNLDTHWIQGERFFMRSLIDYDQAANVGSWQWSASTGTDAAPYFRIMNPILQSQRFDPQGTFIRHYLPALRNVPLPYIHAPWNMPPKIKAAAKCHIGTDYPTPIVDHAATKAAAIRKFQSNSRHKPI